ncbi:hypothetical protein DPMN_192121 [Dreissena polymorpha]|uniref:Uncharacterized protein n=1 Tax=Dreissena polymorpha TaxID=45954 RepID=A0A9D3XZY3_DREPO|nr:hypothetical protein DPMN_192121 [Dreissena polymorpha]
MQSNTYNLQSRVQSLEWTQSDIFSKTRTIESQFDETLLHIVGRIATLENTQSGMNGSAHKPQAEIATVEQKVAATQSNTHNLQSRFQSKGGNANGFQIKNNNHRVTSRYDTRTDIPAPTKHRYVWGFISVFIKFVTERRI